LLRNNKLTESDYIKRVSFRENYWRATEKT